MSTKYAALLVLLLCVVMTAFSRGSGETFAVFLLPLSEQFGWERAAVASVYSVYMIALGFGSLLAGMTFDHLGPRFNYLAGCLLLAIGYGVAGHLSSLWQFYLVIGIGAGIGSAMIGIIPSQSLVSRWFDRRLSSALSVAYAGQGLGTLCLVPIAQLLIDDLGWQSTYRTGGILFAVLLLISLFLPWQAIARGAADNPRKTATGKATGGPLLSEALKTRAFWGFAGIFCFTAIGIFGISLQVVAYLVENGFSKVNAALAFGLMGMLTFPGMALTGVAADYWPKHRVATISYCLSFVGIAALAMLQIQANVFWLGLFVVTFGLSAGARGPIITTLMAVYFSGRGLASIYGASNLGQGLGAAIGAFTAGFLYDKTAGYGTGFIFCAFFTFLGAALFWLIPEIRFADRFSENAASRSAKGDVPSNGNTRAG